MKSSDLALVAYLAMLVAGVAVMAANTVVAGSINSRFGPVGGCLEIRANCGGSGATPPRMAAAFDWR
jgi:hypothetical protein